MPTQIFGMTFSGDGSQPVAVKPSLVGTTSILVDEEFADGTITNQEHDVLLPIAGLAGLFVYAEDQDVTVKTNSSSAPDQTWDVKADSFGIVWHKDSPAPNPITTDITKLFLSKTGNGGAFHLKALYT